MQPSPKSHKMLQSFLLLQLNRGTLPSIEDIQQQISCSGQVKQELLDHFNHLTSFNTIRSLIDQYYPFQEIIIHNPQHIIIKQATQIKTISLSLTSQELQLEFEIFLFQQQQTWSSQYPFCSIAWHYQQHQFRLSFLHSSLTSTYISKLFIRSTPPTNLNISNFLSDPSPVISAVQQHKNIIIAGANSSGKTTFIKTLIPYIPSTQHLIILEDFPELQITRSNTTHILAQESHHSTSMQAVCKDILRMAADYLVLGEIRSIEIIPLFLAMNAGLHGVVTTVHANSARDTIDRLTLLFALYAQDTSLSFRYIQSLICQNIDMIIYLQDKKVKHIISVLGVADGKPLTNLVE